MTDRTRTGDLDLLKVSNPDLHHPSTLQSEESPGRFALRSAIGFAVGGQACRLNPFARISWDFRDSRIRPRPGRVFDLGSESPHRPVVRMRPVVRPVKRG